jgi:GTP-binding protein
MRASGTDEATVLVPPIKMTLEQALEFIDDDELVEVTPLSIRIRKRHLTENDRKRAMRGAKEVIRLSVGRLCACATRQRKSR